MSRGMKIWRLVMYNPYRTEEQRKIYENLSEHEHQRELFSWQACTRLFGIEKASLWAMSHPQSGKQRDALPALDSTKGDSRLDWMMAIPNAGHGAKGKVGAIRGGRMKAEGLRAGVADVFLPYPIKPHSGLWIEMKKKGGKTSPQQDAFLAKMRGNGYLTDVCWGYWEAIGAIKDYLKMEWTWEEV